MLDAGGNPLRFLQGLKKLLEPVVVQMLVCAQKNFPGSDALMVPSSGAMFGSAACSLPAGAAWKKLNYLIQFFLWIRCRTTGSFRVWQP